MPTDIELQNQRAAASPNNSGLSDRYMAARKANADAQEQRRLQQQKMRLEAEIEAQRIAAQKQRDEMEQVYAQTNANQRATINADAAHMDQSYALARDQQQQKGTQKRDSLLAGYDKEAERRKALDQQIRDTRQFDFSTQENQQQYANTIQRDAFQHGNTMQRDQQQHGNTLERDANQFGYSVRENQQQHGNTMQRDAQQFDNSMQRDQVQNDYSMQRDDRQNTYAQLRDQQQQQYTQQNAYQREASEISAKWNEQVQAARNNGMDFSQRQQQEMRDLDASFRKNVMNGPYPEGLKQQAMVEHQRKLSAIIPEEKVRAPQQTFEQSIVRDPETGQKYMAIRDPKGFERFEPLDGGSGNAEQAKMVAEQQKKAAEQRKMTLERHKDFRKLHNEIVNEIDPETLERKFKTDDEINNEISKRFAADEQYYTDSGLPPHEFYQLEARKNDEKKRKDLQRPSQYDVQRKPAAESQTPQGAVNPWRKQLAAVQIDPDLSSRGPLPAKVTDELKKTPGGQQLHGIREKHSSNSTHDQTVRHAADIVINSMMKSDFSNPDLEEAMKILGKAGLKIE